MQDILRVVAAAYVAVLISIEVLQEDAKAIFRPSRNHRGLVPKPQLLPKSLVVYQAHTSAPDWYIPKRYSSSACKLCCSHKALETYGTSFGTVEDNPARGKHHLAETRRFPDMSSAGQHW